MTDLFFTKMKWCVRWTDRKSVTKTPQHVSSFTKTINIHRLSSPDRAHTSVICSTRLHSCLLVGGGVLFCSEDDCCPSASGGSVCGLSCLWLKASLHRKCLPILQLCFTLLFWQQLVSSWFKIQTWKFLILEFKFPKKAFQFFSTNLNLYMRRFWTSHCCLCCLVKSSASTLLLGLVYPVSHRKWSAQTISAVVFALKSL